MEKQDSKVKRLGSTVVLEERAAAKNKNTTSPAKNGFNNFATAMLSKPKREPVLAPVQEENSSSNSDTGLQEEAHAEALAAQSPSKHTAQRLPRNKSLYGMRTLQRSNRPIFKNLTMHKTVKKITRELLHRPDIKYSKQAMAALMRIVEQLLYEQLLKAQAFCLNAGRKTLMLHHLETGEHHFNKPNLGHWTAEDFQAEEARLEPSRFPNSRLSQAN